MILDDKVLNDITQTRQRYEFLSFIVVDQDVICGIVQNEMPKLMMIYRLDEIREQKMRERFLRYGDEWWWESNQSIPINSFIGHRFDVFEGCLRGYAKKSIEHMIGPTFNFAERYLKRVKKKRIDILQRAQTA